MGPAGVRSEQPGGGRSRFHLFVERRRGPRSTVSPDITEFAITACGYALDAPFELQPGSVPARHYPGVLLPRDARGRAVPEYGSSLLCERCRDLAWKLAHSTPC